MLGWQVGMPAVAYIFASQILALIAFCDPSYVPAGWHGALMTIASATTTILLSVFVMQKLTLTEGLACVAHCFGFVAFLAILWAMGPTADAHSTFLEFRDDNGWGSYGLSTLVGLIGPMATFIGGDSAVHLAEELQEASYILPRAMVVGSGINYLVGAIGLVSFMFNMGPINDDLYVYAGQPWVAVIYRITDSRAATIVMIIVVAINVRTQRSPFTACDTDRVISSSVSRSTWS